MKDIVQTMVQEAPQQEKDIMTAADELRQEGRIEIALAMLKEGFDLQTIMKLTRLSEKQLRQLQLSPQ